MENNYEGYSKEIKEYIQYACPFKVGDRVRIDSLYRGYTTTDEVIHYGEITDIQVTTKRQVLFRNGMSDIIRVLDEQSERLLDEPLTEFILTYKYIETTPRKNRLKFWQSGETRETTSTIIIDSYGNNVQRASTVRKNIEKI